MHPEELEIMNRIRQGDMEAYETVFRAYYSSLCLFAVRYLKRVDLAEEIVQDLFLTLWEKRRVLSLETSLKSYLYRAVHNNALKYLQHQKVVEKHASQTINQMQYHADEPVHNLQSEELAGLVGKAFAAMPAKTKEIFDMSRNEGLKYGEIADRLGISVKTVEAHMGSALKILREHLREYLPLVLMAFMKFYSLFP